MTLIQRRNNVVCQVGIGMDVISTLHVNPVTAGPQYIQVLHFY